MKYFFAILIPTFFFNICLQAQSDTLVIKMKNSQIEKIAISQITKIQFENILAVDENLPINTILRVDGNYPNPFSEQTSLEFEIAFSGTGEIIIYDNSGNQIQILKCENCQAGKNALRWNCLDANNNRVQSGVYYYEVRFGAEVQSRKMVVVK
ncbi:T9SS type A sorting domain-containing protein [Bacteroidota bacterium]